MAIFDARPIIAAGGEPFGQTMAAVDGLNSRGFSCQVTDLGGGDWQAVFRHRS